MIGEVFMAFLKFMEIEWPERAWKILAASIMDAQK